MDIGVIMSRGGSAGARVDELILAAARSIDAAIYRFNHPQRLDALAAAAARGIRVRLVLDRNKYEESRSTQELLRGSVIPFRLAFGRNGPGSKMHHKFAIVDSQWLLTGSYNWTLESEEQNFENLILLPDRESIELYAQEFETLWIEAAPLEWHSSPHGAHWRNGSDL